MTVAWSAERYAQNTAHHRRFDVELLASLGLQGDECVLDLGCGVGDLTAAIAARLPAGHVVGLDADADQIAAARLRCATNLRFEHGRAQDLSARVAAGRFDVVVSVAVLHWVPAADQLAVARAVTAVLRPGGRFRADFGGHGQIAATRAELDQLAVGLGGEPAPWYFPEAAEYVEVLAAAGLVVDPPGWIRRRQQRRPFADLDAVRGWLTSQVAIAYLPSLPGGQHAAFLTAVEEEIAPRLQRADGSFDQDYVRLDLLASRPLGAETSEK